MLMWFHGNIARFTKFHWTAKMSSTKKKAKSQSIHPIAVEIFFMCLTDWQKIPHYHRLQKTKQQITFFSNTGTYTIHGTNPTAIMKKERSFKFFIRYKFLFFPQMIASDLFKFICFLHLTTNYWDNITWVKPLWSPIDFLQGCSHVKSRKGWVTSEMITVSGWISPQGHTSSKQRIKPVA